MIERFLERAGLEYAFNDPEGALFDQLLGEGVPFLVVLTSFRLDDAAKYIASDDVSLLTNDLQLEMQPGSLRFIHLLSLGWIGVYYKPSSQAFFGESNDLEESNWTYALTTAWVGAQNTLSLTGGLGEGLQDYRSVRLAEF